MSIVKLVILVSSKEACSSKLWVCTISPLAFSKTEKGNGKLFKVSLNIKKCTNVSGRALHQCKKAHCGKLASPRRLTSREELLNNERYHEQLLNSVILKISTVNYILTFLSRTRRLDFQQDSKPSRHLHWTKHYLAGKQSLVYLKTKRDNIKTMSEFPINSVFWN